MDTRLGCSLPEIDDDEIALIVLYPAPGEEILAALVVGPAAAVAETPLAIPKDIAMGHLQQVGVEGREVLIDRIQMPDLSMMRQIGLRSGNAGRSFGEPK